MAESISDLLVVCDMDGTLLNSAYRISAGDIQTIRLFNLLGGNFTVATGRTMASVARYPELTDIIKPAITSGGTIIYDFQKQTPLQSMLLPLLTAKTVLRDVLLEFKAIGAMTMCDDMRLYMVKSSPRLQGLIDNEQMTYFARPNEDLPEDWNKVLFSGEPDELTELAQYVQNKSYPGVYFVRTHTDYFEMMPQGVTKGSALHELCSLMGIPIKNTIVIGDYYNDLDIMKQAGHAVAMQNAPQEVKDAADEIIDSNDNDGVGQYLYKLIKMYE